jgi:hypothetical protein
MDFGKINTAEDSNEGAVHHVIDPYTEEPAYSKINGKDTPVTVTMLGPDADQVKKYQTEMMRASMKKRKGNQLDPADLERRMTSLLANAIITWQGVVLDGKVLECNRENAMELLNRHTWLREQLAAFHQDRANFSRS